jgi:phage shock protein PspC (stress-responsive transcriptional regulator)
MTQNLPVTGMRWVRSENGIIGGVCTNIAQQLGVDVWMVRLLWIAAVVLAGTGVLAYILCLIALPRTDKLDKAYDRKILGVCARIAKKGNIEVGLVRLLALLLLLGSAGLATIGYVVIHFTLPEGEVTPTSTSKSII